MSSPPDLRDTILGAWKTNNRVTVYLVERLPAPDSGTTRSGRTAPHDPDDRRPHAQCPPHVDPHTR